MEKIIYSLFGIGNADLRSELPSKLANAGASNIRINVSDDAVAPADPLKQTRGEPLPDGIVQCWLPTTNPGMRQEIDAIVAGVADRFAAWLVAESQIIENEEHPAQAGERTHGFAQMAFLTLPENMDWQDWRKVWRDGHTQVAIDTQSNFEYVQNLIVEPLTENAPPFVAIVEECFPPEAMTNPLVFFDAVGDQEKFDRNLAAMMDSCARFITPGTIDVLPTSQYDFTYQSI